jgi:hypothetical protein
VVREVGGGSFDQGADEDWVDSAHHLSGLLPI